MQTSRVHHVRRAATLVEALAALALLAMLLTVALTTRARLARQAVAAETKLRAVHAADALLASWWSDPRRLPRSETGPVPGDPSLLWRTSVVPNPSADVLGTKTVRLEVLSATTNTAQTSVDILVDDDPTALPTSRPARRASQRLYRR